MQFKNARRFVAAAIAVGLAATAAGCSSSADSNAPAPSGSAGAGEETLVIGSMIWNVSNPFYSNFIVGQEETAAELGVELRIVDGGADLGTEVAGIRQLIAQGVDAILITPSDAVGIAAVAQEAVDAGIPVFAVNNRVDDSVDFVTFVGADDVEFGRQQANLLVQHVGETAKVAYMMGALGTSAQLLRLQGFEEIIADYPGIEIIDQQTSNWDAAEALGLVQDWMNKFPVGTIDAIVAQGPEAASTAQYLADNGRTDIKVIVGDYPADVKAGIEAGYIFGTVNQDPRPQGARSVEAAVQWLRGETDKVTRPNEYLPLPIVTKENVAEYAAAWGN